MIITRTPFRISFVGGGTDLKSFYSIEPGQVLSTTIDKYVYVIVRRQIGIVEHKYRLNWRKVEFCNDIDNIENPILRETLRLFEIDYPIEISILSDIPASTGLGSSSAFCVGLVHALNALKGKMITKYQLASTAAHIEIDLLKRTMGAQDHFASSYGNFNVFTFNRDSRVDVEPVLYRQEVKDAIENHMLVFYTGVTRDASEVLKVQDACIEKRFEVMCKMKELVQPLRELISTGKNIQEFGRILHENWLLKRSICDEISSPIINSYYEKAIQAGALGGKLLGAGGGGFLLFFVDPHNKKMVNDALSNLYQLNIKFDNAGSRITYYDQNIS